MDSKRWILKWIDENKSDFTGMADAIWAKPEIALEETFASRLQADYLESKGFKIKWGAGGMPTAFIAEWGKGKPILGYLGEYDALGNLSQKLQPDPEPAEDGAPGQGCGHNLLGTGVLAACVATQAWMKEFKVKGTLRYYGCPAEETLTGKVFMAREGVFDDLDAALNYHPGSVNHPSKGSMNALNNLKFRFVGRTAHAGGAPHLGRSALDAVELMNVGANYLREHVETQVRIHYVITNGGSAPNIVPGEAEVWYYVRAQKRPMVDEVTDRLRKIAEGAAMMTETSVSEKFITGCYNVLNNEYLADLHYENMKLIGPIKFSAEEQAFAKKVNENYPVEQRGSSKRLGKKYENAHLVGDNFNDLDNGKYMAGSSDVGDVSYITPLSMLWTATSSTDAAGHSWGMTACVGSTIGHKGMLHGAKTMALVSADLLSDPAHLKKARKEFTAVTKTDKYVTPLPESLKTPFD